jgi:hypothetical protein
MAAHRGEAESPSALGGLLRNASPDSGLPNTSITRTSTVSIPPRGPGPTSSCSRSSTLRFSRSIGDSALSTRCMPTSMRSAPIPSTREPGMSRRSIGSPAAARTRCTCRSIRAAAGSLPPITAPAQSAWCRSRRTGRWGRAAIWSACRKVVRVCAEAEPLV